MMARGALIVLEGLDRAGKSTQVSMLMEALVKRSIPVEKTVFPDRSTNVGKIINDYLAKKLELPSEAVHLLFCANRWERKDKIHETLAKGTTLIVDRYAGSGAAYSAATTTQSLDWCRSPDRGLPAPDLVVFLDVTEEAQESRSEWGAERYERKETQRKVRENFKKIADPETWSFIDATKSPDEMHKVILEKALEAITKCKDKPIAKLYES